LRPGNGGDLGIDAGGFYGKIWPFGQQVADAGQEAFVGVAVVGLAVPFLVPNVDSGLHGVAFGEQAAVFGAKLGHQAGQGGKESVGGDAGCGQDFPRENIIQRLFDGQAGDGHALGHGALLGTACPLREPGGLPTVYEICQGVQRGAARLPPPGRN